MPANNLDEHQLAQFGQHAFTAGALVRRFHHRHADELAKPASVAALRVAGLDDRRQIVEQRIERLGIASKVAADELGRDRPIAAVADDERRERVMPSSDRGGPGSARMPGPLDRTCGSPLVKTMTSPASIGTGSSLMILVKQHPSVTT